MNTKTFAGFVLMIMISAAASAQNSGSIFTAKSCSDEPAKHNANHFLVGEWVYIKGKNFAAGSYAWTITGLDTGSGNGHASCDPNTVVKSGTVDVSNDGDGSFCIQAYQVLSDDCGEYTADVEKKNDNYRVCNDLNMCTSDSYTGGKCVFTDIICDDGDPGTDDFCDPGIGCYYNPRPTTTTTLVTAPEFGTGCCSSTIFLAMLMVAPVFAYLAAKKQE